MRFGYYFPDFMDRFERESHRIDMRRRLREGDQNDHKIAAFIYGDGSEDEIRERLRFVQYRLGNIFRLVEITGSRTNVFHKARRELEHRLKSHGRIGRPISGGEWIEDWLAKHLDLMQQIELVGISRTNLPKCDICLIIYCVRTWIDDPGQWQQSGDREFVERQHFFWRRLRRGYCFDNETIRRTLGLKPGERTPKILTDAQLAKLLHLPIESCKNLLTNPHPTPTELAHLRKYTGYLELGVRISEFKRYGHDWLVAANDGIADLPTFGSDEIERGKKKGIEKYRRHYPDGDDDQ